MSIIQSRVLYSACIVRLNRPLGACNSNTALLNFFGISNFDKHVKKQLLAKFKNTLYIRFRATLNFQYFKVALKPMYRFF